VSAACEPAALKLTVFAAAPPPHLLLQHCRALQLLLVPWLCVYDLVSNNLLDKSAVAAL
jgi:hypothetical protein